MSKREKIRMAGIEAGRERSNRESEERDSQGREEAKSIMSVLVVLEL